MTARSTSRSCGSCCCPCGLAPVVTVAGGTRWGDATPCYASHHMMLVLLCVFKNYVFRQRYTVFWPYTICRPNTETKINRTSGQTDTQSVFFFSHIAIRNSLRSNNIRKERQEAKTNTPEYYNIQCILIHTYQGYVSGDAYYATYDLYLVTDEERKLLRINKERGKTLPSMKMDTSRRKGGNDTTSTY